jgi:hypothetical protein
LTRLPGASIVRFIQFAPWTGSSRIWRGSMFPDARDRVTSTSGASAVTVTDSASVAGRIWMFTVTCWPTRTSIPACVTVPNPASSAAIR